MLLPDPKNGHLYVLPSTCHLCATVSSTSVQFRGCLGRILRTKLRSSFGSQSSVLAEFPAWTWVSLKLADSCCIQLRQTVRGQPSIEQYYFTGINIHVVMHTQIDKHTVQRQVTMFDSKYGNWNYTVYSCCRGVLLQ